MSTAANFWSLAVLGGVVAFALGIAVVAVALRHSLMRDFGERSRQRSKVEATLFCERLRYLANGPVAEFVIVFATIVFVVCIFWGLLGLNGVR